jgi:hypothetical protein
MSAPTREEHEQGHSIGVQGGCIVGVLFVIACCIVYFQPESRFLYGASVVTIAISLLLYISFTIKVLYHQLMLDLKK